MATWTVWAALALLAFVRLDRLGAGRTFFFDEWDFVLDRWRLRAASFLEPHNGHLHLLPVAVFGSLFRVVGLDHYRVYRLAGIAVHLLVATLTAVYVRRRLGAVGGLSFGAVVLLLGAGHQNILWPFQIGFMGSVAALIGALLLLDRHSVVGDLGAAAALAAGAASSGVGVPALGAVVVELALRRADWRRLWAPLSAGLLYALWYLLEGEPQTKLANLPLALGYGVDSASGAVGGLFALGQAGGRLLAALFVAFLAARAAARWASRRAAMPRTVALLGFIVGFWVLTALSRGSLGDPTASRYVYVGSIAVLLLAAENLPWRLPWAPAAAATLAVLSVWSGWATLDRAAASLREHGERAGAELAALELARAHAPPEYRPDTAVMPQVSAGRYFAAVDAVGSSPAYPAGALAGLTAPARAHADRVLLEVAPPTLTVNSGTGSECVPRRPAVAGEVSEAGLIVITQDQPTEVRLRRFGDEFPAAPTFVVPPFAGAVVVPPADASPAPWIAELRPVGDGAVCASGLAEVG